jgi:hypothetical protein
MRGTLRKAPASLCLEVGLGRSRGPKEESMEHPADQNSHRADDFVFDAFYSGAIGGSVVALFFLLVDSLGGEPLFTPSLMGSVLFTGAAAEGVTGVRLDMVASYTVVHFATFGVLGALISVVVHEVEMHAHHPLLVLAGLLVVFELGFGLMAGLLMEGVITRVGVAPMATANALAALSIGAFLFATHRTERWARMKEALHLV